MNNSWVLYAVQLIGLSETDLWWTVKLQLQQSIANFDYETENSTRNSKQILQLNIHKFPYEVQYSDERQRIVYDIDGSRDEFTMTWFVS